jgi:outer membrane protein assembly factor BamB
MIIFGASDGVIYALDSQTGQLLWSYQTGRAVVSAPAACDDRVFIGSMDGHLYAFGAEEEDSSAAGQAIP